MPELGGSSTSAGVAYEQWVFAEIMMQILISETDIFATPQKKREDYSGVDNVKTIHIDDLVITENEHITHYNIKQFSPNGVWNVGQLIFEGVLKSFKEQYLSTPERKMFLVSQSDSPILRELNRIKPLRTRMEIESAFSFKLLKEWDKFLTFLGYSDEEGIAFIQNIYFENNPEEKIKTRIENVLSPRFNQASFISTALFTFAFERAKYKTRTTKNDILDYLKTKGMFSKSIISSDEIIESFNRASVLMSKELSIGEHKIIERKEIKAITDWVETEIENDKQHVCVVTGDAGSGKTNFLVQVYNRLKENNIPVLALKADRIEFDSLNHFKEINGFADSIDKLFSSLSDEYNVSVLIIDQLDALSLSLSKNRTQLARYTELLLLVSQIKNIKVIVSCRKFDLYNDVNLSYLRGYEEIKLKNFTDPEVDEILIEKGIIPTFISSKSREILRTPLYLSIFIFVRSKQDLDPNYQQEIFSIHDLYEELWKLLITHHNCDKKKLQTLLYDLAKEMYQKQSLQIGKHTFEDDYLAELKFLKSFGIIDDRQNRKISFFHQTFFDYTLARNFVSEQKSISIHLRENTIQDLYQRSRIKAILNYLWFSDEELFVEECKTILFNSVYRIHIKHLVLNIIGNITSESAKVEQLVTKILTNTDLGIAFLNGLISLNWVKFVTSKYDLKYESNHISRLVPAICGRFIGEDNSDLIQFIEKYKKHLDDGQVVWCLSKFPNSTDDTFVKLFKEYQLALYDHFYALSIILKDSLKRSDFQFVSFHLIEQIKFQNDKNKEYLDYHVKEVMEVFLEKNLEQGTEMLIKIIETISSLNLRSMQDYVKFKIDSAFSEHFSEEEKDNHSFLYEMTSNALEKMGTHLLKSKLSQLVNSNLEILVKIALEVISKDPKRLHHFGFDLLNENVIINEFNNGNEHYQYVVGKMIGEIFPYLSPEDQLDLYILISKTPPESISKYTSRYKIREMLFSRYKLMTALPTLFIQSDNQRKKHFNEFVRKFGLFKWEKPKGIGVTLSSGSVPLPDAAYKSLSIKKLKESFKKVEIRNNRFRNKHTMHGHAERFYELVKANPNKYHVLINDLVKSPHENEISSIYIIKGMKGLIDSEIDHGLNATSLFHLIIDNFEFYEFNYAYEVVEMANFIFAKNQDRKILNFIQELTFNETQNIDRVYFWRTVVEFYIKLADNDEYRDLAFNTIERIPAIGHDNLKLALLSKIAWFKKHDADRTYSIFLKILCGFNHSDLYSELRVSIQYMLTINLEPLKPFLLRIIDELDDISLQNWYGQLLCWLKISNLGDVNELLQKAEQKTVNYTLGILEHCIAKLENGLLDTESFEYHKILECLEKTEKEIYTKLTLLIRYIKDEEFLDYVDFLKQFIHSNIRKQDYRDPALYALLNRVSSLYPEDCIELCSQELASENFIESTYYRDDQISILDILVKSYYALIGDTYELKLKIDCLNIIDSAMAELTLKSIWNASNQLNRIIENEG